VKTFIKILFFCLLLPLSLQAQLLTPAEQRMALSAYWLGKVQEWAGVDTLGREINYGRALGCGIVLNHTDPFISHPALPCGTVVNLIDSRNNRRVKAIVIDNSFSPDSSIYINDEVKRALGINEASLKINLTLQIAGYNFETWDWNAEQEKTAQQFVTTNSYRLLEHSYNRNKRLGIKTIEKSTTPVIIPKKESANTKEMTYTVQIISTTNKKIADLISEELRAKPRFKNEVSTVTKKNEYKVWVGRGNKADMDSAASDLKAILEDIAKKHPKEKLVLGTYVRPYEKQ
jgi:hypothetical protein